VSRIDYHAQQVKRAEEIGLRQTSDRGCPRELVGLPHLDERCWCTSRLNDHSATYTTHKYNRHVVIWEPYGAWGSELEPVLIMARTDGLKVEISVDSPWNPGHTIAIGFYVPAELEPS
jgi:hypothetical protein